VWLQPTEMLSPDLPICPMCTLPKPVVESHLIPSSLYDHTYEGDVGPVRVGDGFVIPGGREVKAPLLCLDCEDILNSGGEGWVGPKLAWVSGFPLFDMVRKCSGYVNEDGVQGLYYACSNSEIDIEKLTHFALGIFWRAAVHSWKKNKDEPMIDLGSYEEPIRLWLRSEASFPKNIALHVSLSRPELAQIVHGFPVEVLEHTRGPFRVYWLHLLGALFTLSVGDGLTDLEREGCFYQNVLHPLIVADKLSLDIKKKYLREYMETRQTQAYLNYKKKLKKKRD
jgi:hypothetical protein